MTNPCDSLDAFADGELAPAEAEAFRDHLATCAACQEDLHARAMLAAMEGGPTPAAAPAPPATQSRAATRPAAKVVAIGRPLRSRALLTAAVGAAIAMAAAWAMKVRAPAEPPAVVALADAPTRSIEYRVSYEAADRHRPYDVARGSAAAPRGVPLDALATLEQRKDFHGVAAGLLLDGERDRAKAYLDRVDASPDVEADRAVVDLEAGHVEAAIERLDAVLSARPAHAQALWNRALALRDLGLPLASAVAFDRVAEAGEKGWADEARARAASLRAEYTDHERVVDAVKSSGAALMTTGELPPDEVVRAYPGAVRHHFYHALRAAPSRERVRALAPLADRLDAYEGAHRLRDAVQRAEARDFARRAPLAAIYARDVESADALDAASERKFFSDLRAAGEDDMLLGALLLGAPSAEHVKEVDRLAAASRDPWLMAMADRRAADVLSRRGDYAGAEQRLRHGIALCRAPGLEHRGVVLELDLASLLADLRRVSEARTVAEEGLAHARAFAGDSERAMIYTLGSVARMHGSYALMKAYLDESVLRAPTRCEVKRNAHELLANARIEALDAEGARRELDAAPRCDLPITLARADTLASLARRGVEGRETQELPADLDHARASLPPAMVAVSRVVEGRLLFVHDPVAGEAAVRRALDAVDGAPESENYARVARAYAYRTLAIEAARAGDAARAFAQVARSVEVDPAERCAVAVLTDEERRMVALRDDDGVASVQFEGHRTSPALDPEHLIPQAMQARLARCANVEVYAPSPVHGLPRLLPPAFSWSYRMGARSTAPTVSAPRRLVVSDVEPPSSLGLPRLQPWAGRGSDTSTTVIAGAAATPSRVLAEIADANEIELHAHGLVNLAVSDASFLVLSPDTTGRYALTAGDLRRQKLRGRPIVILGACHAAQTTPDETRPWSMPVALVEAGARAVLASPSEIRDVEAAPFFDAVRAKIRAGATPSVALGEARRAWLARDPASWVRDVIAFD